MPVHELTAGRPGAQLKCAVASKLPPCMLLRSLPCIITAQDACSTFYRSTEHAAERLHLRALTETDRSRPPEMACLISCEDCAISLALM